MTPHTRARLARLHRLTALALAPVYVAILLSGIVLAARAFAPAAASTAPSRVAPADVLRLVQRLEARATVDAIATSAGGRDLRVTSGARTREYDLATGVERPLAPVAPAEGGPYEAARRLHVSLWVGAGWLVTLASFAMLGLVVAGPFLSPPRLRHTPLGWHVAGGWLLYPVVILLPLSAVLMVVPIGRRLHRSNEQAPLSLAQGLAMAAPSVDLAGLRSAERMRTGNVFLVVAGALGDVRYVARRDGVERIDAAATGLARAVHEGAWGGAWSAALNIAGALGLLGLLGSGLLSWARRRRRRATRADAVLAAAA